MSELVSRIQGFLPTASSAYQNYPWVFWVIGGLLLTLIIYGATIPRRRSEYVRKHFHFYSRRATEGDWRFASTPFPGIIHHRRFSLGVVSFVFNSIERSLTEIQTLKRGETPAGIGAWHRDWSDSEGIDWLVVKLEQPRHHRSRKPLVAISGLLLIGLFTWLVARPAIANWRADREQTSETIEAPVAPTHPAPLACDEDGNCAEQDADPTPEPTMDDEEIEIEDSVLVIDLDQRARREPSEIEEKISDWLNSLPAGPAINIPVPGWLIDLFARDNATIISLGEEGFVIVSYWGYGLEYRHTDEQLNQVGDKVSVYGNCGTIVAGQGDGQLKWGVCFKGDEWRMSKYSKGNYNVVVYPGGLVIDSKGFYPRWNPWLLLVLIPLAGVIVFWLRRR